MAGVQIPGEPKGSPYEPGIPTDCDVTYDTTQVNNATTETHDFFIRPAKLIDDPNRRPEGIYVSLNGFVIYMGDKPDSLKVAQLLVESVNG